MTGMTRAPAFTASHLQHALLAARQPLRLCAASARHIRHERAGWAVAIVAHCAAGVAAGQLRTTDAAAAELMVPATLVCHHGSAEAAGADHAGAGWAGACTAGAEGRDRSHVLHMGS